MEPAPEAAERPLRITPDMLLSRRVDFERRMRRLPPVTLALTGLLAVVFVWEWQTGALASGAAIVRAGALFRAAVAAGQYWRLLSATLLHGSVDHLAGNAVALFILGMACEHAFGRGQFVVLWVVSALGGSLVSLALGPGPSVGASGAIFGLQGAAIVLFLRERERLLLRDRRIGIVLLAWAVYTIGAGLLTPFVDNGAHLGGALTGAGVARGLHPVVLEPMPAARAAALRRRLFLVAAVLAYTLLGWMLSQRRPATLVLRGADPAHARPARPARAGAGPAARARTGIGPAPRAGAPPPGAVGSAAVRSPGLSASGYHDRAPVARSRGGVRPSDILSCRRAGERRSATAGTSEAGQCTRPGEPG